MDDIFCVVLSKPVEKALPKLPRHIVAKLGFWVQHVSQFGLRDTMLIKGFHDEPLKGKRLGQRSIRLSKAYRAIYEVSADDDVRFISIEEVNKHAY